MTASEIDAVQLWLYRPTDATAEFGRIETWDTSQVTDMAGLFYRNFWSLLFDGRCHSPSLWNAEVFNEDSSGWNVSRVTDMSQMFRGARAFNQDLSKWDVSRVTNMDEMFLDARAFNQDLSDWDESRVTNVDGIFFCGGRLFNQRQGLSDWDLSCVTKKSYMFCGARVFDQDLSAWNVSSVTNMSYMFCGARVFDQDLSAWNVSCVTKKSYLFCGERAFNQDLSAWDVSSVTNMSYMFCGARAFNQNLSGWDVSRESILRERVMGRMFLDSTVQETLFRSLTVSSFFEGVYPDMPREEHQAVFADVFPWPRRRAFMLFLVNNGFLYSASVPSNYKDVSATMPSSEVVPCDAIFEVEDIYRYICKFL